MKNFNLFLALTFVLTVQAKVFVVPENYARDCSTNGVKISNYFDWSNFELLQVNDTHLYFNGSIKFLKEVKAPVQAFIMAERYDRGQWLHQLQKSYSDICKEMHSPSYMMYETTKHLPPCPRKAGSTFDFNMVLFKLNQETLDEAPSRFMGRWRINSFYEFINEKGKTEKFCFQNIADLHKEG